MADLVTIRNSDTLEERQVNPVAARFLPPGWGVVVAAVDATPKKNASADEWRSYVVDRGYATEEDAADLNRDQLIGLVPSTNTEEN